MVNLTHLKGPITDFGAVVVKDAPTPLHLLTFSLFPCVNSAPMLFSATDLNDDHFGVNLSCACVHINGIILYISPFYNKLFEPVTIQLCYPSSTKTILVTSHKVPLDLMELYPTSAVGAFFRNI